MEEIYIQGDESEMAVQELFTPELLAEIDAAHAEIKSGKRVSLEELDESLAETKAKWLV